MTYKISTLMFILWGMLAAVTMIVSLDNSASSVGGSTASFQSLANTVANPQAVGLDEVTLGDATNPISGGIEFVQMAVGWVVFIARSLMLQSPIWEGWTQPIRWGIMLISLPYMWHVTTVMMGAMTNMSGGIAKLIPGLG